MGGNLVIGFGNMALNQKEFERLTTLLEARKTSDFSGFTSQGDVIDRTIKDIPSDIVDTGAGVWNAAKGTQSKIAEAWTRPDLSIPQRIAGTVVAPAQGVSRTAGELFTGAAKLLTTDEFEKAVNSGIATVAGDVANTSLGKGLANFYKSLPESDKYTLTNIIAPIAETMATVGTGGAFSAGSKVAKEGLGAVVDTGVKATKGTLSKTGEILGGASDITKGIATQVKDFGGRVVTGAKETAQQSRRLDTLPKPEAGFIRAGADDASVKLIKESTPSEINLYKNLVKKAKDKSSDMLAEQPKVVIGQEFMKPVDFLLKTRKSIGAKLGAVRQKLSNTPIDVTSEWKQFRSYLDGRGITVDKNGKFTGAGNMAKSDLVELQKMYDELRPDKTGKVMRSQKWLDEWNQRTYKEYDLRQAREQTFSDDVTRTVEKARSIFKEALPPEYRRLSSQYAESSTPIQEVVKLLGYKGDIDKLTAKELKAAEVALRVVGNASDRPQAVIDELLRISTKYGYKSDVDLKKIILFADALENVYPNITPTRGFTGSTARGINQSGVGVAADLATGNVKGVLGQALNSSATQKEIQDALDAFLASLSSK